MEADRGKGIRTDVRRELDALVDEKYRVFHSRLLPGTKNILGVRVPALWKLARRLVREEGDGYLARAADGTYEEIMLQGMVICLLKEDPEQKLGRLPAYMAKIDNWAECDIICSGLKDLRRCRENLLAFLKPYLKSGREFEVRFAVVLLLNYFIEEDTIGVTLRLLESVDHEGYYVKLAVAWAISMCFVKFRAETLRLLESRALDDFTYNKALQKIAESYQVDRGTKDRIRAMRRRESRIPDEGRTEGGSSGAAALAGE